MNVFDRFLKKTTKKPKGSATLSTRIDMLGFGGAIWPTRDYENFSKETYLKNVIAYRSIEEIARSVSCTPWKLYEKTAENEKEEVKNHPILDLLKHPNPQQSFSSIMLEATSYLVIAGNTYFERIAPLTGRNKGIPKEIYVQRPDRMKIKLNKDTGRLKGYEYELNGAKVIWNVDPITMQADILHVKLFHPLDDFYGAAVTESVAREVDTSNENTEWNMRMLQNEGRPGMVLTTEGNLTKAQKKDLRRSLRQRHEGASQAGRSMILEGGVKADPYGWSPKEMDNIEGGRELARRIAFGFGVPPVLIGIPGDATYLNYESARQAFWETTVFFYINLFKDNLNNWFFDNDSDLFLDYVPDKVSALSPKREALWKRAELATHLTINEKRKMVGMGEISGGDIILVPRNMIDLKDLPNVDDPNKNNLTEDENNPSDEDNKEKD